MSESRALLSSMIAIIFDKLTNQLSHQSCLLQSLLFWQEVIFL